MTIVASNSLTVSNINDGTITHTAYANSTDGTNGFTTLYPNLNLLDGTKDFSGTWTNSSSWVTDGTYKGLTVKKRTAQWSGIYKTFTAPKDGVYTFSAYIKSSGNTANVYRYGGVNSTSNQAIIQKPIGNNFDWTRDSITLNLKANDSVWIRYEISGAGTDSILWTAGHKYEPGSTATPYMPSSSEATTADWPSYIGQYTDFTQADSTNPSAYTWSLIRGNDGATGPQGPAGSNGDPGKIVSETEPTTRFKGLTWKYSGTSDLTASDGTVILSGTEYYWSGTNWILSEINSHNINGDNLSVTNGTFTDGKIKSTWDSGTASGSTEIENSHINMSATDSTSKVTNSLGLDVQQGLGMRWSDPTSNQSRSVLLDYGNLSFDRNGVAAGLSFDGTNLSSSMPIQAPNTIVKTTQFTVSGIGIRLDRLMSFVAVTFYGQASSTINTSPTVNNLIPVGFRPINAFSIDYMVPGNVANSGYMYFNPDGSIRIMATINSGYYIRGTRLYITNDSYPS